jgi:NAD-dependent dihydropyrimidine dehydrogenase PreA subunit
MAYVIALPCIGVKDTACIAVCPMDCIHPTKSESGFAAADQLLIDPAACICCGLCAAECPVSAIFDESDLPPEWNHFIAKNADFFKRPIP